MDRQTLRDWVHRYNAESVDGLHSRGIPGRSPALNDEQMEELRQIVLDGPDPERHQVVRWSVRLHVRSVGKLLHRLKMTRLQPRPYHPQADIAAQEAYKKTSLAW